MADSRLPISALGTGATRPEGWLRDWAELASQGITGHLDEHHVVFGEGWSGVPIPAHGANPDATGWPLEQSAYWLDGALRLAVMLGDDALHAKVTRRLDAIVDGVESGGETFIHWLPKEDALSRTFNGWAHAHLGRALVAYYRATGDQRILDAAVTVYAEYPFDPLVLNRISGASNIDPMLSVLDLSGDERIRDRLIEFAERDDYRAEIAGWKDGPEPGHGVTFYEAARLPAMLSTVTGRADDLDASVAVLGWSEQLAALPFGVLSSEEFLAGIGATRNAEGCNVSASMWTHLRMLEATGDGQWADRVERAFFNAGPGVVSFDFHTACYYQSPNRYSETAPFEEPAHPGPGSYRYTELAYEDVLCCVGNLNRTIPFYVEHLWMATPDGGLAATLYGPGRVRATLGGADVTIVSETAYPFEEDVRFTLELGAPTEFPLQFRIPAWCEDWSLSVGGQPLATEPALPGYVRVTRTWSPGDAIVLHLGMRVRIEEGHETPFPQIPHFTSEYLPITQDPNGRSKVRPLAHVAGAPSPFRSVLFGPLLFALPLDREDDPRVNDGFFALPATVDALHAEVIRREPARPFRWDDRPLELVVNGRRIPWTPTEHAPLPPEPVEGGTSVRMRLVPYGATKHRMSMFAATR